MTIKSMKIIFGGQSSDEFGTFMGYIGSIDSNSNDEESELITSTNPFKNEWDFHYKKKTAPLEFTITLIKSDGTYFNSFEERQLKKWLVKDSRQWLQVDQEDLYNIMFYCHMINPRKVNAGANSAGIQFTCVCDAPWAWSGLEKRPYISTTSTSFSINSVVDFDNYIIYPTIIIKVIGGNTVSINNTTTNETMNFTGCTTNETITIDCAKDKLKSDTNRILLDSWNKQTISICEGKNLFNIMGNCSVTIQYRTPIRVGG